MVILVLIVSLTIAPSPVLSVELFNDVTQSVLPIHRGPVHAALRTVPLSIGDNGLKRGDVALEGLPPVISQRRPNVPAVIGQGPFDVDVASVFESGELLREC